MRLKLHGRRWSFASASLRMIAATAALFSAVGATTAWAQGQQLISGFEATRSVVPQRQPRPQGGPDGIDAMLEASEIDADVEMIVGYSKLISLKKEIAGEGVQPVIAIGDPIVLNFQVLNSRTIRLVATTVGETDLSILTSENKTYVIRVRVVYDLEVLRSRLKETFPDAVLKIVQMRQHVIVSGEARDLIQIQQILSTIEGFLESMFAIQQGRRPSGGGVGPNTPGAQAGGTQPTPEEGQDPNAAQPGGEQPSAVTPGSGGRQGQARGRIPEGTIINLIRVPGSKQVLLKVRICELSRNAMRQMGFSFNWANSGLAVQSAPGSLMGQVVDGTSFDFTLDALRENRMARVLAEPNLVTMSGHQASFLNGGEIPIPVPQAGSGGGGTTVTIQYKEFGTRLNFTPYVLDHEVIRLTVTPEVSAVDPALSTTIFAGAAPTPGFRTRRTSTTVEMRQGQTLGIAGLMQLEASGQTSRTVGVGDLPYVGALFRDNLQNRTETEMLVTVTPYLTAPMNPTQVPRLPGDEITEPNDLEFYLLGRIEGRTGRDFRATAEWDDPIGLRRIINMEKRRVQGAHGFSE